MNNVNTRFKRLIAVCAASILALLGACGGGDDDDSSSSSEESSSSSSSESSSASALTLASCLAATTGNSAGLSLYATNGSTSQTITQNLSWSNGTYNGADVMVLSNDFTSTNASTTTTGTLTYYYSYVSSTASLLAKDSLTFSGYDIDLSVAAEASQTLTITRSDSETTQSLTLTYSGEEALTIGGSSYNACKVTYSGPLIVDLYSYSDVSAITETGTAWFVPGYGIFPVQSTAVITNGTDSYTFTTTATSLTPASGSAD